MEIIYKQRPRTTDYFYEDIFDIDDQFVPRKIEKYGDSMTFWSRYDPIRQPKGNTDHWSKFRQRTSVPVGPIVRPQDLMNGLGGKIPGDYINTRPSNSLNKNLLRNSYNERARDGFRYWLIDRPKPTSFGKYGMGSYKTVLGIGNAPRT